MDSKDLERSRKILGELASLPPLSLPLPHYFPSADTRHHYLPDYLCYCYYWCLLLHHEVDASSYLAVRYCHGGTAAGPVSVLHDVVNNNNAIICDDGDGIHHPRRSHRTHHHQQPNPFTTSYAVTITALYCFFYIPSTINIVIIAICSCSSVMSSSSSTCIVPLGASHERPTPRRRGC